MSAFDTILRQLAHYSYHVGQIVTLSKQRAADWTALSIPLGQSEQYSAGIRAAQGTNSEG